MGKQLRRIGKFYSSIMIQNIGIFIFIGLLSVLFQENGWLPNENIYAISQFTYATVLPLFIAYTGGSRAGNHIGGILAVLFAAGCVMSNTREGIIAGMVAAPLGAVWKCVCEPLIGKVRSSAQMLIRNLMMGLCAGILSITGYYILAPVLELIRSGLMFCINQLMEHELTAALNLIIEPAKILFLNNIINHGILIPLGMEQISETGKSVLFLVETNPGPGLGMLAALYCTCKNRKSEYGQTMAVHAVGGLHEVYFPKVLENLWLLLPLSLAGMAGTAWFEMTDCGLYGPVSPGSIITIVLMAGKSSAVKVSAGILISAGISFAGSMLILRIRKAHGEVHGESDIGEPEVKTAMPDETPQPKIEEMQQKCNIQKTEPEAQRRELEHKSEKEDVHMKIRKVGFVCDAGVGTSAMGAALFRRQLAGQRIEGIEVEAFASDQIPGNLDLIVCQKDYRKLLSDRHSGAEIFAMESLMDRNGFERLITIIRERNR